MAVILGSKLLLEVERENVELLLDSTVKEQ